MQKILNNPSITHVSFTHAIKIIDQSLHWSIASFNPFEFISLSFRVQMIKSIFCFYYEIKIRIRQNNWHYTVCITNVLNILSYTMVAFILDFGWRVVVTENFNTLRQSFVCYFQDNQSHLKTNLHIRRKYKLVRGLRQLEVEVIVSIVLPHTQEGWLCICYRSLMKVRLWVVCFFLLLHAPQIIFRWA